MPIQSRWNIEIPNTSLPSLLFTNPTHILSDFAIFIDAENPQRNLTPTAFRLWSQRFAVGLRRAGLQDGDRVLLFSPNNIFYPVVFMGVIMAGGIFTGANPAYVVRELVHQLRMSQPRFMLCAFSSLEVGLEAASQVSLPRDQVFLFETMPAISGLGQSQYGCNHWSTLIASVPEGKAFCWKELTSQEECQQTIVLNTSSGTTGPPKCVEVTHLGYVATTLLMEHWNDLARDGSFRDGGERWLCFLPLYHAMGQAVFISLALRCRTPVYIMPQFHFTKMLDAVQEFRITKLSGVPSILVALAKDARVRRGDWDLSSVWQISSGAAPLAESVIQELKENWAGNKGVKVTQGYGMTELTCAATFTFPAELPHISSTVKPLAIKAAPPMDELSVLSAPSSVGELIANCEGKLMNDAGTAEVPQGMPGELWVRGPVVMKGYWRDEAATRATITEDGWMMTGDVCYVDEFNNFHIVDRKKDLIKVSGHQVAPAELEALLLTHPAVLEAAVVGIRGVDGSEQPRAFLVRGEAHDSKVSSSKSSQLDDESTLAREIESWVAARVYKTKRLTGGVRFVTALPKGPTGKVIRRALRDGEREQRKRCEGGAKL